MSFYIQLNTGLIFKSESIIHPKPSKGNKGFVIFRDQSSFTEGFVFKEEDVVARWKDEVVVPEPTEEESQGQDT